MCWADSIPSLLKPAAVELARFGFDQLGGIYDRETPTPKKSTDFLPSRAFFVRAGGLSGLGTCHRRRTCSGLADIASSGALRDEALRGLQLVENTSTTARQGRKFQGMPRRPTGRKNCRR